MSAVPLVSVIVSSFNYARFLPEAIESALSQTYPAVEVIVVDDGSTDDSRDVIARYGGRVRPVLKANGGQGSALNAGFAASHGEVVLFLDSDDVLLPRAAANAAGVLGAHPRAAKVHWPVASIDADGKRTGRTFPNGELPEGDLLDLVLRDGPDAYPWPPTSGNAWARWYLQGVMPLPAELFRTCPDLYLTAWAPFHGRVGRVGQPQSCWRVHGANRSWSESFDARLSGLVGKWDWVFSKLAAHCHARGLSADIERWRRLSWFHRISRAADAIAAVVPSGNTFILADEDEWETGGTVRGRRKLPFVEREGVYWGPPSHDAEAISELRRLRRDGAALLVFAWPAFWWLEHYAGMRELLDEAAQRVHADEDIIVYDLRTVPATEAQAPSAAGWEKAPGCPA